MFARQGKEGKEEQEQTHHTLQPKRNYSPKL